MFGRLRSVLRGGGARRRFTVLAVTVLAPMLALAGAALVFDPPEEAKANVQPTLGIDGGTVRGRGPATGFHHYGAYEVNGLVGWCVDSNKTAPDDEPAFTDVGLPERAADTKRAIAWTVGVHGADAIKTGNARKSIAVQLVVHDFMGANNYNGVLDVFTLTNNDLSGFGSDAIEGEIIEMAKLIKVDALFHANHVIHETGATVDLVVQPSNPRPGERANLIVTLTSNDGKPIDNKGIFVDAWGAILDNPPGPAADTDSQGKKVFGFTAIAGENRFTVKTTNLPSTDVRVLGRAGSATMQRIAVPRGAHAENTLRLTAIPQRKVSVQKTTDAGSNVPLSGLKFVLRTSQDPASQQVGGVMTTNEVGATNVISVDPGQYWVHEIDTPAHFNSPAPLPVDLSTADQVGFTFANTVKRGKVTFLKTDSVTKQPLPGVKFVLSYDANKDGTYEQAFPEITTTNTPATVDNLLPGKYQLTETDTPDNYEGLSQPIKFDLAAGETKDLSNQTVNRPLTSVEFVKTATSPFNPDIFTLAGAKFVVREGSHTGTAIGDCTTTQVGTEGRCGLPPNILKAGVTYCWEETVTPPGWGPPTTSAVARCFEAGGGTTVKRIDVAEVSRYVQILGRKFSTADNRLLADAVHDLYRKDDPNVAGNSLKPAAPADAPVIAGYTWVGRARSDANGQTTWPVQLPGFTYCAKELSAPAGFQLDNAPIEARCTAGPVNKNDDGTIANGTIDLPNAPVPVVAGVTVTRAQQALPRTGSNTTALLTMWGGGLMAAGAGLLLAVRRRRAWEWDGLGY